MERQNTRLNREWHRSNRMPKNATQQERVKWHLAHAKYCACRPVPEKLAKEIKDDKSSS